MKIVKNGKLEAFEFPVAIPTFEGATDSADGKKGSVPAPLSADKEKFLKADGTWGTPENTTYATMKPATADAEGASGLVPSPGAGKHTAFLRGDGTWAIPVNTDTKVTNVLNNTSKAYITGTTSAATNTGTQVFDENVYLDTVAGTLVAKTFKTSTGIEIY